MYRFRYTFATAAGVIDRRRHQYVDAGELRKSCRRRAGRVSNRASDPSFREIIDMPAEHGQLTFDLNRRGIGRIVLHSPGGGYRMSDITCTPQDSVHFYMSEDGGTTAVTAVNMGGMHPCHDGSLIPTVDPVALAGALRCNIN